MIKCIPIRANCVQSQKDVPKKYWYILLTQWLDISKCIVHAQFHHVQWVNDGIWNQVTCVISDYISHAYVMLCKICKITSDWPAAIFLSRAILWAANLKPILVAHSCMAFTACCRCISMVSRERPRKQIARSSTKSALKMSFVIQEGSSLIFSPKHVTARTPPVGTPSSG